MGLWDSISNGLAAAANHGAEIFQKRALLEAQDEAEALREQRREEYLIRAEERAQERKETARKAEISAVNQRADEMGGVPAARSLIEAGIADRSAWTPEHQAAADQAMQIRRDEKRTAAAADLGYLDTDKIFSAEREDKRHLHSEKMRAAEQDRLDARATETQDRIDARHQDTLNKPTATDRDPQRIADRLKIAREDRLLFEKQASELRKAMEGELKDANLKSDREAIRKRYEPQLADLAKERKEAQEEFDRLRKMLDTPPKPTIKTDTRKLAAIVEQLESGGRDVDSSGAVLTSSKGAKGRMQVMDDTNRDPGYGVTPARDDSPRERARVGRDYSAAMAREFDGDLAKALAAYNAGPGAVKKAVNEHGANWLAKMPEETRDYVRKGVKLYGSEDDEVAGASPIEGGRGVVNPPMPTDAPRMAAAAPAAPRNPDRLAASEAAAGPVRITGNDDYNKLPPGTLFIGPDGRTRRKA